MTMPIPATPKRTSKASSSTFDSAYDPRADEILYPTGISPAEDDLRSLHTIREATPGRPSSFFFVSKKFESLDYMNIINRLEIEKEKLKTFRTKMKEDFLRIVYFMVAGVLTAFIGVFLEYGIISLGHVKFKFLSNYTDKHFQGSAGDVFLMVLFWFLGAVVPIMIGSSLVVFIAPFAAGGGVSQCIAYLNGVRVPDVLSIKGAAVKVFSTICTVISGLAGGKEGPMMHLGATIGGALPSAFPSLVFKSEHERRDLAAAGFGGGIAVAFGAPIGGLLLAVEEGISFWDVRLMWRTYLGILMSYLVATILLSVIEGVPGYLNSSKLLILGEISSDVTNYEIFELFFFALQGLIGGLFGASIVKIHIHYTLFRRRYMHTKTKRKLMESFLVGCVVATLSLASVFAVRNCSKYISPKKKLEDDGLHFTQLYCSEEEYSDISVMFLQGQTHVMHALFGPDHLHILPLFVYAVIYYILISMTMGLSISGGIFVPQLVFGAVWGRMFGIVLQMMFPKQAWPKPAKYAYMGATAQLSGTVGKTFSVLVIMVEASGDISISIPLMVVVTVAKFVETFFVLPIYETQMHLAGLPFLASASPPLSASVATSYVMSPGPLVTLPLTPTVQTIKQILDSNTHNGFPVLTKDNHIGLILRQQLLVLLKFEAYRYPPPTTPKQMIQCRNLYHKYARKRISLEGIKVDQKYMSTVMDLSPYYNPYPFTVKESMPLNYTYSLFRHLGLRHIIVLDDSNEP